MKERSEKREKVEKRVSDQFFKLEDTNYLDAIRHLLTNREVTERLEISSLEISRFISKKYKKRELKESKNATQFMIESLDKTVRYVREKLGIDTVFDERVARIWNLSSEREIGEEKILLFRFVCFCSDAMLRHATEIRSLFREACGEGQIIEKTMTEIADQEAYLERDLVVLKTMGEMSAFVRTSKASFREYAHTFFTPKFVNFLLSEDAGEVNREHFDRKDVSLFFTRRFHVYEREWVLNSEKDRAMGKEENGKQFVLWEERFRAREKEHAEEMRLVHNMTYSGSLDDSMWREQKSYDIRDRVREEKKFLSWEQLSREEFEGQVENLIEAIDYRSDEMIERVVNWMSVFFGYSDPFRHDIELFHEREIIQPTFDPYSSVSLSYRDYGQFGKQLKNAQNTIISLYRYFLAYRGNIPRHVIDVKERNSLLSRRNRAIASLENNSFTEQFEWDKILAFIRKLGNTALEATLNSSRKYENSIEAMKQCVTIHAIDCLEWFKQQTEREARERISRDGLQYDRIGFHSPLFSSSKREDSAYTDMYLTRPLLVECCLISKAVSFVVYDYMLLISALDSLYTRNEAELLSYFGAEHGVEELSSLAVVRTWIAQRYHALIYSQSTFSIYSSLVLNCIGSKESGMGFTATRENNRGEMKACWEVYNKCTRYIADCLEMCDRERYMEGKDIDKTNKASLERLVKELNARTEKKMKADSSRGVLSSGKQLLSMDRKDEALLETPVSVSLCLDAEEILKKTFAEKTWITENATSILRKYQNLTETICCSNNVCGILSSSSRCPRIANRSIDLCLGDASETNMNESEQKRGTQAMIDKEVNILCRYLLHGIVQRKEDLVTAFNISLNAQDISTALPLEERKTNTGHMLSWTPLYLKEVSYSNTLLFNRFRPKLVIERERGWDNTHNISNILTEFYGIVFRYISREPPREDAYESRFVALSRLFDALKNFYEQTKELSFKCSIIESEDVYRDYSEKLSVYIACCCCNDYALSFLIDRATSGIVMLQSGVESKYWEMLSNGLGIEAYPWTERTDYSPYSYSIRDFSGRTDIYILWDFARTYVAIYLCLIRGIQSEVELETDNVRYRVNRDFIDLMTSKETYVIMSDFSSRHDGVPTRDSDPLSRIALEADFMVQNKSLRKFIMGTIIQFASIAGADASPKQPKTIFSVYRDYTLLLHCLVNSSTVSSNRNAIEKADSKDKIAEHDTEEDVQRQKGLLEVVDLEKADFGGSLEEEEEKEQEQEQEEIVLGKSEEGPDNKFKGLFGFF